jgi:NAD(P)-dependent dehydrogenase (short-subunit alcohol dehydrogenase family)
MPGTRPSDAVIRVNLLGLRHLTESLWPRLDDGGTVVNVTSMVANQWKRRYQPISELLATADFAEGVRWWEQNAASIDTDPYTFSKEAVLVYTMQLAGRGLPRGIRVNDVGPGPVETPILPEFSQALGEAQLEWMRDSIGRVAAPDDIAQVLAWLAIGEHRWLNGQHLVVDGGLMAGLQAGWISRSGQPRRDRAT